MTANTRTSLIRLQCPPNGIVPLMEPTERERKAGMDSSMQQSFDDVPGVSRRLSMCRPR